MDIAKSCTCVFKGPKIKFPANTIVPRKLSRNLSPAKIKDNKVMFNALF